MYDSNLIRDSINRHYEEIFHLREKFLRRYENNKDSYDEIDIKKLKSNDWSVWRFLRPEKYNIESALEKLDKTLKWRKDCKINNRDECEIPKEFFELGGIFQLNHDKNGISVLYLRVKVNLKVPKLSSYIKDFITFIINKMDEKENENGFIIVFDLTDCGVRNADLDLCSHLISLLRFQFPEALRYCLVYNLPWILRSFWTIVKLWIPTKNQELINFANKDEIRDYIDLENLPKYLGGLCGTNFATHPSGCKSVTQMAEHWGFTNEEIQSYYKIFEPNIKDTKKLLCNDI